ncbi:aromatase/cyclase [Parafrankia sp. FMc2]|uniref:aromatase/cyclase n=1 Tax=Parafrankia sp. FMc2 TaxID=3233196 RepID=UPI0034D54B28
MGTQNPPNVRYTHRTEHRQFVAAPARAVYDLLADVTVWPAVFGPCVYAHRLSSTSQEERVEIWASVNGSVTSWVSRRWFDPHGLRLRFAREVSRPPIDAMDGEWQIDELPGRGCEVILRHGFEAAADSVEWITSALDRNSAEELAALTQVAECGHPVEDVLFSFTDTRVTAGAATDAYGFVARAGDWASRLPHVRAVRMTEPSPGVQDLEMETVTDDGSTHSTRSLRVCAPPGWIAYKQLQTPRLLLGHSGLWTFADGPGGAVLTARHTVLLDPAAVHDVLGPGQSIADARAYVRRALGRNSSVTMGYAADAAATV